MTSRKLAWFILATAAAVLLMAWTVDSFGFRSPWSALLLNWLAMSWVALVGQSTAWSFGAAYYAPRPFEQGGQVYERLGVRLYKKIVRRGPLALLSPRLRLPRDRTLAALHQLDRAMREAETGHAIVFMLVLLLAGWALLQGWLDAAAWLTLFNVLINGYPVMLQRYNRIKLMDLIRTATV